MYIINFIRGFCMALADSVPGVSGGTIAFLLGFYNEFITSLNDLISGNKEEKKKAIFFLLKIGFGWIIGFIIAVLILGSIFEKNIYIISSVFLGFIIFALPIVINEEKDSLKGKYKNILFTIIGILIVALITYFNPISGSGISVQVDHLNIGLAIYIFIAAMVVISAMVLPGISGSTLLLIFGLYVPIISAIRELLHFNFSYLPIVAIFGFGIIMGIVCTIRLIKKALEKYHSETIYLIIGLMIGSLYAIVMGPTTLETAQEPMSLDTFHVIYFILGGLLIFGLQKLKRLFLEK